MGFLSTSVSFDMRKAIVSLWVRVPSETKSACMAADTGITEYTGLNGIVPFITWGPQLTEHSFEAKYPPSHIGMYCSQTPGGDHSLDGALKVLLQTGTYGSFSGAPELFIEAANLRPQVFENMRNTFSAQNPPTMTPDVWHHVLLSWDVTTGCSSSGAPPDGGFSENYISSYSRIWCAVDDVNQTSDHIPGLWPGLDLGFDQNGMVTSDVYAIAGQPDSGSGDVAVGRMSSTPLHIPAPAFVDANGGSTDPVLPIELAHLQLFTGISIDTGNLAHRRFFVTSDGKPAGANAAQNGLGVVPKIKFTKADNWKIGKNEGSGGNLVVTGTITQYDGAPGL